MAHPSLVIETATDQASGLAGRDGDFSFDGGVQPFRMVSDRRARNVARDLRSLLKSEGFPVTLTVSQALTARLFGYENWSCLRGDLGNDFSLDDVYIHESEIELRKERVLEALRAVPVSDEVAERIYSALKPTDRAEFRGLPQAEVIVFDQTDIYHPVRLVRLLGESETVLDEVAEIQFDASCDVSDLSSADISALAASRIIEESVTTENIVLLPYDAYPILQNRIFPISASAKRVAEDALRIIDAQAIVGDLTQRAIPSLLRPLDHYVHFGRSSFPSPYPGLAIEGCYVRTTDDGDVVVSAVVALSNLMEDEEDYLAFDPGYALQVHTRGHTMRLADIVDGGVAVALDPYPDSHVIGSYDSQGRPPYTAGLDHLWRVYLRPVAGAAMNALDMALSLAPESRIIGISDGDSTFIDRLSRARTERQMNSITAGVMSQNRWFVFQILASPRSAPEAGFQPGASNLADAFWPTIHMDAWIDVFVSDRSSDYDLEIDSDRILTYLRSAISDKGRFSTLSPTVQERLLTFFASWCVEGIVSDCDASILEVCDAVIALGVPEAARFLALKASALMVIEQYEAADREIALLPMQDYAVAAWLRFARAMLSRDPRAHHLFRFAFEADVALARTVRQIRTEGFPEVLENTPLRHSGSDRGLQLLQGILDEVSHDMDPLFREVSFRSGSSPVRH